MKSLPLNRLILVLGLWACLFCPLVSYAESSDTNGGPRYIIGLSPFLPKEAKDPVYRQIIEFVLDGMPLNSSLGLYDAYNLRLIAKIEVPDARPFRSGKTRANQFAKPIAQLRGFLAMDYSQTNQAGLNLDQALRFPQFMNFISENLSNEGHPPTVVLLGSPLYLDPREPRFSMVDGYFPSDGHLLATREKSIFGLKNREASLKNITVHFGFFGDPWVTDAHQDKIARFWTLFLKGQGARLATFTGDLSTIFAALKTKTPSGPTPRERDEIDTRSAKIEMTRVTRDIGLADWITRDSLPNVASAPPRITIGPIKIGIRWQDNVDLDLYARRYPDAEELYFEHTRSAEGYYFKDHRSSPGREYEFIEFEKPVDIWQIEARINFYEGSSSSGPSGEIRVEFDGKIYTAPFAIRSENGNEGREGSRQNNCWFKINLPEILKLTPARDHQAASQ